MCPLFDSLKRHTSHSMSFTSDAFPLRVDEITTFLQSRSPPSPSMLPPTLQPSRSEQIFHLASRIDQHLDIVEEKIDGITVPAAMIRSPSPQETELANQLEAQKRQMEAMMAMMEAMRIEKEKQEAKHKAEVEAVAAKLHAEQQEARELAEIQTKLLAAAIPPYRQEHFLKALPSGGDASDKMIKHLQAAGEIILYVVFQQCYDQIKSTHGGETSVNNVVKLIITTRHVYSIRLHSNAIAMNVQQGGYFLHSGLHYMPIYTFDKPLQLKQIKMLSILTQPTQYHQAELTHTQSNILAAAFPGDPPGVAYLQARTKFESVIRLIPGSYQNGDWRQMDGFFGLYFNETTMEVSEFPGRAF